MNWIVCKHQIFLNINDIWGTRVEKREPQVHNMSFIFTTVNCQKILLLTVLPVMKMGT